MNAIPWKLSQIFTYLRSNSAKLTESILEIIKQSLESGEDVLISGFGKFYVKDKKKQRDRNPQVGEDLMLAGRRVATFRCSPVLREKMNHKSKPWFMAVIFSKIIWSPGQGLGKNIWPTNWIGQEWGNTIYWGRLNVQVHLGIFIGLECILYVSQHIDNTDYIR